MNYFKTSFIISMLCYALACPFTEASKQISIPHPGETSCIIDHTTGSILHAQDGNAHMIPASVLKLITAQTSLQTLGGTTKFKTEIWGTNIETTTASSATTTPVAHVTIDDLYIVGYGDPKLVSEEWTLLVKNLPELTVKGNIYVDDSYFAQDLGIIQEPGEMSPYNALNGAFASNFNTLAFRIYRNTVLPEEQTPLTPYTKFKLIHQNRSSRNIVIDVQPKGEQLQIKVLGRVRNMNRGFRVHLGFDPTTGATYAGHLFQAIWNRDRNTKLHCTVHRKALPQEARLIHTHVSTHDVNQAIHDLMEYSNNFLANQILLVAGAKEFGPPATLAKGLLTAQKVLRSYGINGIVMKEGSGLDPENRVTACELAQFLYHAWSSGSHLHDLLQKHEHITYKTGTFIDYGVRTLAGYLHREDNSPGASFAFLCNGKCPSNTHDNYKDQANQWAEFLYQLSPLTQAPTIE